jgi:integrase/recombinase XerD
MNDLRYMIQAFLRDCRVRELSPHTVEYYRAGLANFSHWWEKFSFSQPEKMVTDITPDLIRTWLLQLRETHNPGGVHAKFRALRAFLNWWQEETDAPTNPMAKVRPPKVERPLIEGASLEDIKAMLATCTDGFLGVRDRALLMCLLDTGARAREFLAVDLDDVDLITGSVILRKTKARQPRVVFIGRKSRRALRAYLRFAKQIVRTDSAPALWISRRGDRLAIPSLQGLLKRRGRLGKLPNIPSAHDFRRAHALMMLRAGTDIITLARLMGHASLEVLTRYLRQTTGDLQAAHAKASPVDNL